MSLNVASEDRQTAYESTLSAKEALENGQTKLESLAEHEELVKEQLREKKWELHYLQKLHRQMKRNEELKAIIETKQKETELLQETLLETEGNLRDAREEVKHLRNHLRQARKALEASCSRLQELERQRAELQAKMKGDRREVNHTLTQIAASFPMQEPVQEIKVCTV